MIKDQLARDELSVQRGMQYRDEQVEKSERNKLIVDDLHDFIERELPVREAMLSPWLLNQSLAMIHSWRGTGKTHVALGIAYAIASGGQFLNWKSTAAKKVLLVDGEMPGAALQVRLAAIIASSETEAEAGMLRIVTPDIQTEWMPDLATDEGQFLLDEIIEPDTALIIIDNLSSLARTGKENESESWQKLASWALRQRAQGRSVLFIHHSGKDLRQRGTSRREDILDVVICLRRPADYIPTDGACFEIHYEKARHIHGDDVLPIEARLTTDEHGKQCWTSRLVEESTFDRVVTLANEGLNQKEIADELSVNKSTVSRAWRKAESQGLIKGGNYAR